MAREWRFFDLSSVFDIIKNALPNRLYPSCDKCCRVCGIRLLKEQERQDFCSQLCAADFWKDFRDHSPRKPCIMPACSKPCFVEKNGRVHDFCGKTHASEYNAMMEEFEKERVRRRRLLHYSSGNSCSACSGGGGGGGGASTYAARVAGSNAFGSSRGSSCAYSGATNGVNVVSQEHHFGSGVIRFYNRDEPYYQFTNFYEATITLDGKEWPTTEHYFQAQKFIGTPFTEVIRCFQRPREAFKYSRIPAVSRWRRNDWEGVKINVMRKALIAKFSQHKDLRELLLSTGTKKVVEHSPYDSFWGNGGNDRGQNYLGLLLMEIRADLQKGRKMGSVDTTVTTQSHPPSTVYRETFQRSASDPSGSGSSSSSTMECSNPPAAPYNISRGNSGDRDDIRKNNHGMFLTEGKAQEQIPQETRGATNADNVCPEALKTSTSVDNKDKKLSNTSTSIGSASTDHLNHGAMPSTTSNQGRPTRSRIGPATIYSKDLSRYPLHYNPQPIGSRGQPTVAAVHVPVTDPVDLRLDPTDSVQRPWTDTTQLKTPIEETTGPVDTESRVGSASSGRKDVFS